MGLISTALQIGRSALLSYQSALQVVGNNIANAGSAEYTRQSTVLSPTMGGQLPEGFQVGAGVALTELKRCVDETLENRIRIGLGDQGAAQVVRQALGRLEVVLNELSDNDLSTLMEQFFGAFSALQNNPHDLSARGVVLTAGESLVNEIRRQRSDTRTLVEELNTQITGLTEQANQVIAEIAELNRQIVESESAGRGMATALRDQRDAKLRQLSELIAVQVRPQSNGSVNVYLGNELLIQAGIYRSLGTQTEVSDDIEHVTVVFADDEGEVDLSGGQLRGLVEARDTHALGHIGNLDVFAAALIQEVNKVHSQGQGLVGYTSLTGTYGVQDTAAALNSDAAALDLRPRNGSFQITVTNRSTDTSVTATIEVDLDGSGADTTLDDLVAAINANTEGITAVSTADGRLQIVADNGYEFTFGQDSSFVLAALGVNTFFTGRAAHDVAVNDVLTADPNLLAAARSRWPGDGTNAAALAEVGNATSSVLNGQTLIAFYNDVASRMAVQGNAAKAAHDAATSIMTSLQAQRESISGVSLDEEAIQLIKFERAFQGAARYVSVINGLIEEMLGLVR